MNPDTARALRADLRERTKIAFRRAREDAALSQEQLGRILDVSRAQIERWEDVQSDRPVPAWIEARMPEAMLVHWRKHMDAMRREERGDRPVGTPESQSMALVGDAARAVEAIVDAMCDASITALERASVLEAVAKVEARCASLRSSFTYADRRPS